MVAIGAVALFDGQCDANQAKQQRRRFQGPTPQYKRKAAVAKKRQHVADTLLPELLSTPAEIVSVQVLPWALDEEKTHVVQLYIEMAEPTEAKKAMMLGLQGSIISCILSEHGNYVIQKIITCFPLESLDWLLSEISAKEDILNLIKHKYGCRIFCRLFEKFNEDDLAVIWETILDNVDSLIAHEFGCYPLTTYVEAQNAHQPQRSKDNADTILIHLLGVQPLFIWQRPTISWLARALLQKDGELQNTLAIALNTCILLEEYKHLTRQRQKLVEAVDQRLVEITRPATTDTPPMNAQQLDKVQPENMQRKEAAGPDTSPQIWTCEQVERSFGVDGTTAASTQQAITDPSMNMMMPTTQFKTGMPLYWVPVSWGTNSVHQQPMCWGWIANAGQDTAMVAIPISTCEQRS